MIDRREHPGIATLKQQLADGRLSRREFLRYATLLGMAAGTAYMWAGKITGQPLAPPARAGELPRGGRIRIAMRVPRIDDPHTYSWLYDSNILRQVCGYLTRTGHDNVTRPHLCESWEASDDLRTWKLKLRAINWHNGRPFTAEDVAWNLRRVLDPDTGSSVLGLMRGYILDNVDTGESDDQGNPVRRTELWDANAIEVLDDHTLQLNLKEPHVAVPEDLFHYPLGIIDPEEGGRFGVGSNGTEAFDLVDLEVGRKAVLRARDDYYGRGPYVDEIEFIDLGDNPIAVVNAIQSRQVEGMYEGNIEQLAIFQRMEHVTIYDIVTADTAVARMRVDREPFSSPLVRRALRLATDQAQVLAIAHRGVGAEAEHHHVSPIHPDYSELDRFVRDIDAAKALLAEAGYPDGIDVEITCKPDPSWELTAVETLVSQWREAGIRCRINTVPSSRYWEIWTEVPFGFTSWVHRPLGFMALGLAYRSGVPWNETRYANPQFDALLTQAEGTLDIDRRKALIGRLEQIMQEDGPISQPIWRSLYVAYDKRVKGFAMHPTRYIFGEELAIEM